MSTRGWNSNVWKDGKLKDYLVTSADLQQNVYYAIARKLDDMSRLESKIQINSNPKCREHNRVIMYNNRKENDIMQLFYYIRCALAHGRFHIYIMMIMTLHM